MDLKSEVSNHHRKKVTRSFTLSPSNGDLLDELAHACKVPVSRYLDFVLGRTLPGMLSELRKQQEPENEAL